jgi:hypothetical protein
MKDYFKARIYFDNSPQINTYYYLDTNNSKSLNFTQNFDFSEPTYTFSLPTYLTLENALINLDNYTPNNIVPQQYQKGDIIVLTKFIKKNISHTVDQNFYSKLIGIFQDNYSIHPLEEQYYSTYENVIYDAFFV